MSKIDLDPITSGYNLSKINANFQKVEDELNNKVLYRDSPAGEPNSMSSNLDMNGRSILNANKISSNVLELGGVQVVPTSLAVDPYNGTREALRRSYAEVGYNVVDGSFEAGGTLVDANDVLLHEASGKAFSGPAGPVAAGTDPMSGGFVDVSGETLASPSGAGLVGTQRSLPVVYTGTVQDYINTMPGVNIWEYSNLVTSKPDINNPSTWDWTPAFSGAIASGRKVNVPKGVYKGANIPAAGGMIVCGEGGEAGKTVLESITNNAPFFLADTTIGDIYNVYISGVDARAASGVTGASFWGQTSKQHYTAYAEFRDVEIQRSLRAGFDGFFIFSDWYKCRSGYRGAAGATHKFIDSIPKDFGQAKQTNLNRVINCRVFGSVTDAAVDIAYGARWDFFGTDFEALDSVAIRARGIYGGSIDGCWFEGVAASYIVDLSTSPNPNAQGSRPWLISNFYSNMAATTTAFVKSSGASSVTIEHGSFSYISAGVFISGGDGSVKVGDGVTFLSGAGASTFNNVVIPAPLMPNNNILTFGVYGAPASRFTNNGFTSILDGASLIGNSSSTARFTLSGVNNAGYYQIPSKVLDYIKGKKVKVTATGSFVTVSGAQSIQLSVWDSRSAPSNVNFSASANIGSSTSTSISSGYFDYKIDPASTSLHVGLRCGGDASGAIFVLESIQMILL